MARCLAVLSSLFVQRINRFISDEVFWEYHQWKCTINIRQEIPVKQKAISSINKKTHWKVTIASSTVNFGSFDAPLFLPFFFFPDFFLPDFFLGGMFKCSVSIELLKSAYSCDKISISISPMSIAFSYRASKITTLIWKPLIARRLALIDPKRPLGRDSCADILGCDWEEVMATTSETGERLDTRRLEAKKQTLDDAYAAPANFLEIDVVNPETHGVGKKRYTDYEVRMRVSTNIILI